METLETENSQGCTWSLLHIIQEKRWWALLFFKVVRTGFGLLSLQMGFFISHFCYWVWLKILKLLKCRKQMVLGPAIEQKTFRRDAICGTQRPCSSLLHLVSFCISAGLLPQKQKKWTPLCGSSISVYFWGRKKKWYRTGHFIQLATSIFTEVGSYF